MTSHWARLLPLEADRPRRQPGLLRGQLKPLRIDVRLAPLPWWGHQSTTTAFANALGSNLGAPNVFDLRSPYFAWSCLDGVGVDFGYYQAPYGAGLGAESPADSYTWAQASLYTAPAAVPGPLPIFGAGAAFGFSRRLRKRIQPARPQASAVAEG